MVYADSIEKLMSIVQPGREEITPGTRLRSLHQLLLDLNCALQPGDDEAAKKLLSQLRGIIVEFEAVVANKSFNIENRAQLSALLPRLRVSEDFDAESLACFWQKSE